MRDMEDYHGLPKNFGDPRLLSIFFAICDHKVNPKDDGDLSPESMNYDDRGRIAAGSRQDLEDRSRIARIASGPSEMK